MNEPGFIIHAYGGTRPLQPTFRNLVKNPNFPKEPSNRHLEADAVTDSNVFQSSSDQRAEILATFCSKKLQMEKVLVEQLASRQFRKVCPRSIQAMHTPGNDARTLMPSSGPSFAFGL